MGSRKLLKTGMVTAREWRAHAVGMAPYGGLGIEEADGGSSGLKSGRPRYPSSWKHVASKYRRNSPFWPPRPGQKELGLENGIMNKTSLDETGSRISDVLTGERTCRSSDVRDRDLGIKWPQWHTLIFKGQVREEMRYVCPRDVKKLLLQQARTVYWKKWAVKHEYEEFIEGGYSAGAGSGLVAQEDEGRVD